jgi:hypothetical protein
MYDFPSSLLNIFLQEKFPNIFFHVLFNFVHNFSQMLLPNLVWSPCKNVETSYNLSYEGVPFLSSKTKT